MLTPSVTGVSLSQEVKQESSLDLEVSHDSLHMLIAGILLYASLPALGRLASLSVAADLAFRRSLLKLYCREKVEDRGIGESNNFMNDSVSTRSHWFQDSRGKWALLPLSPTIHVFSKQPIRGSISKVSGMLSTMVLKALGTSLVVTARDCIPV